MRTVLNNETLTFRDVFGEKERDISEKNQKNGLVLIKLVDCAIFMVGYQESSM